MRDTEHQAIRLSLQVLQLVFGELRRSTSEEVGSRLSMAIAGLPKDVRHAFERHYAQDRLHCDQMAEQDSDSPP
jgi:hypothetical protein